MKKNTPFTLYTTSWCGDCIRTKQWLADNNFQGGTDYIEIDIEEEPDAVAQVETYNNGNRVVPTLVLPDGQVLTEPSFETLQNTFLE